MRGPVLFLFLCSLLLTVDGQNFNDESLDCWDECVLDTASTREEEEELANLYEVISGIRKHRILHGVTATAIVIDTSIHPKHSLEPDHAGIFTFQQNLAALIAFTMPGSEANHPIFANQFDADQAWYCDSWGCNGRCEAADNILYNIEDVLESTRRGQIEDSCHLAAKAVLTDADCGGTHLKPLLVAIVNSEFDDHIMEHHRRTDSSCHRFKHRIILGTHAADRKQLHKFASTHQNFAYVPDTPAAKKVLSELIECMTIECCPGGRKRKKRQAETCERTVSGYNVDTFSWSN